LIQEKKQIPLPAAEKPPQIIQEKKQIPLPAAEKPPQIEKEQPKDIKDEVKDVAKTSPSPPPPPGPCMGKGKKIQRIITLVPNWTFSGANSVPIPIDNIDWPAAIGFERSQGGSTGVLFVGWPDNKVAVLKGSITVLADYFAYQIGMWCNFPLAKMSLIVFPSSDFRKIFEVLDILDQQKPERLRRQHGIMKEMPMVMLMEFVKGKEFSTPGVCDLLCSDKSHGQQRCYELGRLIMFDVFINNWDRLPIIWDSPEGNIDNILFLDSEKTPIIGIDQSVTSIIKPEEQIPYFHKVRQLLTELCNFDFSQLKDFPFATKIQQFILAHQDLKFDIGRFGLRAAWIGMMQGCLDIIQNISGEKLKREYDSLNTQVELVFTNMVSGKDTLARYGLNRVDLQFLMAVLALFKEFEKKLSNRLKSLQKFV